MHESHPTLELRCCCFISSENARKIIQIEARNEERKPRSSLKYNCFISSQNARKRIKLKKSPNLIENYHRNPVYVEISSQTVRKIVQIGTS